MRRLTTPWRLRARLAPWLRWGVFASAMLGAIAHAAPPPIVIGQSLPMTGKGFPIANRVSSGAQAFVERVNASGGIQGRRVELVTLDDGGDPKRMAENLRTLVNRHNAVAITNCLGERACVEAAEVTRQLQVPLVGPISGASAIRAPEMRHVFTLRPDDAREADALVNQLRSIGVSRAALLTDEAEPRRIEALSAALRRAGMLMSRIHVEPNPESMEVALTKIAQTQPKLQALVLNLGDATLDVMGRLSTEKREGLPITIATLSSSGLTQVTRMFRDRLIGFTSVVPNPEAVSLPVVRSLHHDAEEFVSAEAVSFEGLEAYIALRVCVEAARRAGPRVDAKRMAEAIEGLGTLDMGGLRLTYTPERHHGSEFIEIGLRARDGRTLR